MAKFLKELLSDFHPSTKDILEFHNLAKAFLYGGYISVTDQSERECYRIYIRTVEFYCHCEDDKSDIKDPIVYHRNGKYTSGNVPYFPLMSFHAHASGYDITFENAKQHLRSSALIRAYEIYDVKAGKYLVYSQSDRKFIESDEAGHNQQSTYLYYFLNGFIGDSVKWIDTPRDDNFSKKVSIRIAPRKNVYEYKDGVRTKIKDLRPWSFTRTESLPF